MTGLRLDKWLWYARFCKSRSLAQHWIAAGEVWLNDQPAAKANLAVKAGDQLDLPRGARHRVRIRVVALAERRGDATAAALLYQQLSVREAD